MVGFLRVNAEEEVKPVGSGSPTPDPIAVDPVDYPTEPLSPDPRDHPLIHDDEVTDHCSPSAAGQTPVSAR